MEKRFVIVHDTETDDWNLEPNEELGLEDSSYVKLIEILLGGFEMLSQEEHTH